MSVLGRGGAQQLPLLIKATILLYIPIVLYSEESIVLHQPALLIWSHVLQLGGSFVSGVGEVESCEDECTQCPWHSCTGPAICSGNLLKKTASVCGLRRYLAS